MFAVAVMDAEAAGHSQVEHQVLIVIQRGDEVLAASLNVGYAAAGDALDELAYRRLSDGVGPGDLRRTQPAPDEAGTDKVLAGVFDFGEFGHFRGIIRRDAPPA